jgi:hypothetical protein
MDEKLQKALEFSNYRQTLNNQLRQLKVRTQSQLIFAKNGGSFTINRELICFFNYIISKELQEITVLDDNEIPIQITNPKEFLDEITIRYFEVTNDYFIDYQQIKKSRSVKSIVDLEV